VAATLATKGDTRRGVDVLPSSNPDGTSGRWDGADSEIVNILQFLSAAEIADVRAFSYGMNVTDALHAASQYIQTNSGGTLLFPRGGYLIGKQTFQGTLLDGVTPCAYGAHEVVTIKNCMRPVKLSGYGAVLRTAPGLKWGSFNHNDGSRYDPPSLPFLDYDYYGYIFRAMFNLEGNLGGVIIEGFELDGNNTRLQLGGHFGDSDRQLEGAGMWLKDNAFLDLKDLYIHHQTNDGIIVSTARNQGEGAVRQPVTLDNVRCRNNGRNGMSPVGVNMLHAQNSDFSDQGQAFNTVSSELVRSSPGAGVDIEANFSRNRNLIFDNITALGNYQNGITMASGDSRGVLIRRSKIEGFTIGRPDVTFEDCTVIGYCTAALSETDQYKATVSGVTLTMAGTGPYTLTRSAGDFAADGFKVGEVIWLSGAGLNAANKLKRLLVTALTATNATVVTVDGSTMVAEGPIASCKVATAMTQKDGQRFVRCRFTYDASLTEIGALQNSNQSVFNDFPFGVFESCDFDTMTVPLPNMNNRSALSTRTESYPLIRNTRFRSTSSTAVNLDARWQGYNYINSPAKIGFSTYGRKESGDIILNGVVVRMGDRGRQGTTGIGRREEIGPG
jgi:hypothetical protein